MIVGLGNPGARYTLTRHNAGFIVVDELCQKAEASYRSEFDCDVAGASLLQQKVFFVKPLSFMNLSGRGVAALARFYKVPPEHIIVIHDDLDMEFGKVRSKVDGGHGGHNGVRDIIAMLGTDKFQRVKVGIGRPVHPGVQISHWVLSPFTTDEVITLQTDVCNEVLKRIEPIFRSVHKK